MIPGEFSCIILKDVRLRQKDSFKDIRVKNIIFAKQLFQNSVSKRRLSFEGYVSQQSYRFIIFQGIVVSRAISPQNALKLPLSLSLSLSLSFSSFSGRRSTLRHIQRSYFEPEPETAYVSVAPPAEPRGEKKLFFVQILGSEKLLKFGEKWAVKIF